MTANPSRVHYRRLWRLAVVGLICVVSTGLFLYLRERATWVPRTISIADPRFATTPSTIEIALGPDGQTIATFARTEETICVCDSDGNKKWLDTVSGNTVPITNITNPFKACRVQFSANGRFVASRAGEHLALWERDSGRCLQRWQCGDRSMDDLWVAQDGSSVSSWHTLGVYTWTVGDRGGPKRQLFPETFHAIWSVQSVTPGSGAVGVAYSEDSSLAEKRMGIVGKSTVALFSLASRTTHWKHSLPVFPNRLTPAYIGISFDKSGHIAAVGTSTTSARISTTRALPRAPLATPPHGAYVLDTRLGKLLGVVNNGQSPTQCYVSGSGQLLATTLTRGPQQLLQICEIPSLKVRREIAQPFGMRKFAFWPDDQHLAVADSTGKIKVWRLE